MIDGFATSDPTAPRDNSATRALRGELQLERVVSYFTSPADLEARVSAAVTVAGMSKQVRLNLVQLGPPISTVPDSDPFSGIRDSIIQAGRQRVLQIELDNTWWSTRLYLTAWLANWLTEVRRFVVVQSGEFVGLLSTPTIVATLLSTRSFAEFIPGCTVWRRQPPISKPKWIVSSTYGGVSLATLSRSG